MPSRRHNPARLRRIKSGLPLACLFFHATPKGIRASSGRHTAPGEQHNG
jgi:hypothetical protein